MRKKLRPAQNKDGLLHDLSPDDQLSRFSDDILVTILSYLPIKYAAATSMLSRRWRHLWCQTARLDFEDKERLNKARSQHRAETIKYINWVNRIIRQHKNPTVDEFKICFNLDKNAKGAIGKWIEFAISKNVQRLELDLKGGVYNGGNYAFPDKIFARKCKPSSKRSSFNIPVRPNATVIEIKFLKALILKHVDVNDEGLRKILSNCPVLEHLLINESCKLVNAKIHGKGLALKTFEIIYCDGLKSIEISDSNIVSFDCQHRLGSISYRLKNLEKLEKLFFYDGNRMKVDHMFFQICCNIPYLQVLELRSYYLQKNMQVSTLPKLIKLKQLIVEVYDGNLSELTSMVEACPNLRRFKVKLIQTSVTSGLINKAAKQPHQHLEVVEIDNYYGQNSDLELAMYFIENSVALKKLVIKPQKQKFGHAAKLAQENNATRYRALLEPKTTLVGVELVIV